MWKNLELSALAYFLVTAMGPTLSKAEGKYVGISQTQTFEMTHLKIMLNIVLWTQQHPHNIQNPES